MNLTLTYSVLLFSALFSGLLFLFIKSTDNKNKIKLLLPFSGAFLLAICILHLIPELYVSYKLSTGLFILLGFVVQIILEVFSHGIEHGHFHPHKSKVIKFPYALFISLCIHAAIEGMALINPSDHHHIHNQSLLIGIIIHKIPIAIVLVTLLRANGLSKTTTLISLFIFSIAAPLGLFFANEFSEIVYYNSNVFIAVAVGVFLHISTTILFETSENHKFNIKKYAIIILGLLAALLTL